MSQELPSREGFDKINEYEDLIEVVQRKVERLMIAKMVGDINENTANAKGLKDKVRLNEIYILLRNNRAELEEIRNVGKIKKLDQLFRLHKLSGEEISSFWNKRPGELEEKIDNLEKEKLKLESRIGGAGLTQRADNEGWQEVQKTTEASEGVMKKAYNLIAEVYDVALSIDEAVNELLGDPKVLKLYDYDGIGFKRKGGQKVALVIDGKNFLKALPDNLSDYFKFDKTSEEIVRDILKDANANLKNAQAALSNWQEYRVISVVSPDLIDEWLEMAKSESKVREIDESESKPREMSKEETNFFAEFEEQLKEKQNGEK